MLSYENVTKEGYLVTGVTLVMRQGVRPDSPGRVETGSLAVQVSVFKGRSERHIVDLHVL